MDTSPEMTELPLSVTLEQVTWHAALDPDAFDPTRFPIWIWLDQPSFYGLPTYRSGGPKVGQDEDEGEQADE